MRRFAFSLQLLEDTVISRSAATAGGHESLDYLPGQILLGACAAKLYRQLESAAYEVFHSGRVRFGNALPLAGEQPAWPLPFAWHERKADPANGADGRLDSSLVFNFQEMSKFNDGAQPKQLRGGYVDRHGRLHQPDLNLRMKTAIDPAGGRAAEAQLFGYQAIARGTRFGGWLEADESVDADLFQQITESLTGDLLLGRSRSAEYGRARLALADFSPPQGVLNGKPLTLWLLSDLAVQDQWSRPTLDPSPGNLGLPAGYIVWDRTFIRTRGYAPWNRKRGAPDLERSVIQQGSVIAYSFDNEPDSGLLDHCASGLGLHREAGLGRGWVNPDLLSEKNPEFSVAPEPLVAPEPKRPRHPLINWLEAQTQGDTRGERIEREARELFREYGVVLKKAAAEKGLGAMVDFGPSRSQWGHVLEAARNCSGKTLVQTLFEDADRRTGDAVAKPSAEGWGETFWDGQRRCTLSAWLREQLEQYAQRDNLPRLVQRLAHLCRDNTGRR